MLFPLQVSFLPSHYMLVWFSFSLCMFILLSSTFSRTLSRSQTKPNPSSSWRAARRICAHILLRRDLWFPSYFHRPLPCCLFLVNHPSGVNVVLACLLSLGSTIDETVNDILGVISTALIELSRSTIHDCKQGCYLSFLDQIDSPFLFRWSIHTEEYARSWTWCQRLQSICMATK